MQRDQGLESPDTTGTVAPDDDARVVVDFSIGPSGVGPVVGFDSGEFYPFVSETAADHDLSVPEDSS